jgi:hypothetical protein
MTAEVHDRATGVGGAAQDHRLSALIDALTMARRRSVVRMFVEGLVASIAIGLGLFCLLTLAHVLLGGLAPILSFSWLSVPAWLAEWRPAPMPQHLLVSLFGVIAAIVVAQFAAASRRPGIMRMAQAADHRFTLNERLTTALQLAKAPAASRNVVSEALMRDVARRTATVDPRKLTPLRLKWQALSVPLLAVLAAILIIWPPEPVSFGTGTRTAVQVVAPGAMNEEERLGTAAQLQAIAAILIQDGEERTNPTLQALGNELNRLGLELQANPNVDRAAVARELERLRDLAAEAYTRAGVTAEDPANHAALLDTAIEAVDPALLDGGANLPQATIDENAVAPELDAPFEGIGIEAGRPGQVTAPPPGMDVRAEDINPRAGAGAPADLASGGLDDYDFDDPYYEGDIGNIAAPAEAEIIGAGEGFGGDLPGLGAGGNPLAGDGAPILPGLADGEMLLADPDPGNGRMITLNLPPLAELMAVGEDGLQIGAWRAFIEQQVERGTIPAEDLEAVGRYFQAILAETDE